MKLAEIRIRNQSYHEGTFDDEKKATTWLLDGATPLQPAEGGKYSVWKKHDFYFVKSGEEVAGWVKLEPETVHGIEALRLDLVFFIKKFRGTRAIAVLLHGVHNDVRLPIVLTQDDTIFADGIRFMLAVKERGMFKLSVIAADGTRTPLISIDKLELQDTILIEDLAPLSTPAKDLLGNLIEGKRLCYNWYGAEQQLVEWME